MGKRVIHQKDIRPKNGPTTCSHCTQWTSAPFGPIPILAHFEPKRAKSGQNYSQMMFLGFLTIKNAFSACKKQSKRDKMPTKGPFFVPFWPQKNGHFGPFLGPKGAKNGQNWAKIPQKCSKMTFLGFRTIKNGFSALKNGQT